MSIDGAHCIPYTIADTDAFVNIQVPNMKACPRHVNLDSPHFMQRPIRTDEEFAVQAVKVSWIHAS
jgi:hypothetical protein